MKIAVLISRILLGLIFVVFGLNIYFQFLPMQTMPGDAGALSTLMFMHKWFHFYGIFYLVGGFLLLIGYFVPLGLALLAPIIVNILLFHVTLNPGGIAPGLVCTLLEVFLIYVYRRDFRGLLASGMEGVPYK
jgi:putative oxidoreductase